MCQSYKESVCIILVLLSSICLAQDSLNIELVGYNEGIATQLALDGDIAYVLQWTDGMRVVDIQNPQQPQVLSTVDTPGRAWDITIVENYAYIADWDSGIAIVDISDSHNPILAGQIEVDSLATGVEIQSNLLYVAANTQGLFIYDIGDPIEPLLVGATITRGNAWNVFVKDDLAFIQTNYNGLLVLDVLDPSNITQISVIPTPGHIGYAAFSNDYLFMADGSLGIWVFDITDPFSPEEMTFLDTPGFAVTITVKAQMAYIADGANGGLRIFDISDLFEIEELGFYDTPGPCEGGITVDETGLIYVGDGSNLGIYRYTPNSVDDKFVLHSSSLILSSYPNPFNSSTTIEYRVGANSNSPVRLYLYDLSGRLVQTLVNERLTPGNYRTTLNANALTSGVYVVRMEADPTQPPLEKGVYSRKVVVVK